MAVRAKPHYPRIHLREWREYRALTQAELASMVGVTVTTLSRLAHHHTGAQPGTRRKLAAALDIEPHELLGVPPGMTAYQTDQGAE